MKYNKTVLIIISILLMVSLTACGGADNGETETVVVVGSKPFTEGYLGSELVSIMIEEHTDLTVEKVYGIAGGTSNLHDGMLAGEFDVYPEYTGTSWLFVLQEDSVDDSDELYENVKSRYEEEFNMTWSERFGFNNTYTLAVRQEDAEEYGLETFSDLAAVSDQFVFGAEYDFFERDDGYDGLVDHYGFQFDRVQEMDIGLKYQAIESGQVSVINAFSTDGPLHVFDNLKILEDDMQFFPAYDLAAVIRMEVLDDHPEILDAINLLAGQITEEEIARMNYLVDEENQDTEQVARDFLTEKGLI
jgi:glycine betaine/choline ABC-type transport system substrate-binding protein